MEFKKKWILIMTTTAIMLVSALFINSWKKDSPTLTETTVVPPPTVESFSNVVPPATSLAAVPVEDVAPAKKMEQKLKRKKRLVGRVRKGSFTVWADPAIPEQGQGYAIHVVVKLPGNFSNYSAADLSGTLDGSDGYDLTINSPDNEGDQTLLFEPGSGTAELILEVPGGATGIADTLVVRSHLLNESQSISVKFK